MKRHEVRWRALSRRLRQACDDYVVNARNEAISAQSATLVAHCLSTSAILATWDRYPALTKRKRRSRR